VSKVDPKHGRWILPVAIAALIGFTVVFVRALPAADVTQSTTTTTATTTTTTLPTTTTTSLPADIRAFLGEVDRFEAVAKELRDELNRVNDDWENREESGATFDETEAGFQAVIDGQQQLGNEVAATTPPEAFADVWPDTINLALELVTEAEAVLEGLKAPDDGSARREAVEEYNLGVDAFLAQLEVVRQATPG